MIACPQDLAIVPPEWLAKAGFQMSTKRLPCNLPPNQLLLVHQHASGITARTARDLENRDSWSSPGRPKIGATSHHRIP